MNTKEKIKILALCDSPTASTGFAQVSKNILRTLYDTGNYDIDIIGINYDGSPYDKNKYPYNIYPAKNPLKLRYQDYFGRQLFLDMLVEGDYDLVWTLQDTFIVAPIAEKVQEVKTKHNKNFKWIYYFPIDSHPNEGWLDAVKLVDYPITYTNYGKGECISLDSSLEDKVKVIYHGSNSKDFYPYDWSNEERLTARRNFFGQYADSFIFMNINRNQPRKDMLTSLLACRELYKKRDNAYFYFHCNVQDEAGINMLEISRQIGLDWGKMWGFPTPEGLMQGFDVSMINKIYNSVDCVFSTTLGEGWGLSATEAMATKTPIIIPDNTSAPELIGKDRGFTVKSGGLNKTTVLQNDNDRMRPVTDVDDLVEKMEFVMDNKEDVAKKTKSAYNWIKEYEWAGKKVGGEWIKIFKEAYESKN